VIGPFVLYVENAQVGRELIVGKCDYAVRSGVRHG
jgi:hypothetical protein